MNLKDRIIQIITGQSSETATEVQVCVGRFQHFDDLVKSHEHGILRFHADCLSFQREDEESADTKMKALLPRLQLDKIELKKALSKRENAEDLLYKAIEKADLKYTKYVKNGLGKERKNMPQIDADNIKKVIKHFEDKDVDVAEKSIEISKIKPSQKDFDDNKIIGMMKKGSDKINVKYLLSKDGYLVDGHHRWASALEEDDKQNVSITQIDLPIKSLLKRISSLKLTYKENEDEVDDIEKSMKESTLLMLEAAYGAGHIDKDTIQKARSTAGLTPVRRQVVRRNGTVYMKTVYVKEEEKSQDKARNYITQDDFEQNMQKGDVIKVHFTGWSTGATYEGKAKIDSITDSHIKVSLIEDVCTHNRNNYIYKVGNSNSTFEVPRTTNKDWSQKLRIEPIQEVSSEQQQRSTEQTFDPVKITDVNQVSNGDYVKFKHDGVDVSAKIASIWVQPNGKVRLTMKDEQGKQYYKQIGGRTDIWKIGTDSNSITSHQGEIHTTTDEELVRLQRQGVRIENKNVLKELLNTKYKNFNMTELIDDFKEEIRTKLGPAGLSATSFTAEGSGSGLIISVRKGRTLEMRRTFSIGSDNKPKVYHAYFKLSKTLQAGDFGKKLFRALNKQYINIGLSQISVTANIDVGGYAWGKYGFRTSEGESSARSLLSGFTVGKSKEIKVSRTEKITYRITQQDVNDAKAVVDDFYRRNPSNTPFPVKLLCGINGGKAGKVALMGMNWRGVIDLTNSEQKADFDNYINS